MSSTPNFNCWGFVIDTNEYAGNFERELCAYCTGVIGECEVGKEYIQEEDLETHEGYKISKYYEDIAQVADDHGCSRPVSIYPSPKGAYNSLVIFMYDKPSENFINHLKQRAENFCEFSKGSRYDYDFKVTGYRLVKFTFEETVENIQL